MVLQIRHVIPHRRAICNNSLLWFDPTLGDQFDDLNARIIIFDAERTSKTDRPELVHGNILLTHSLSKEKVFGENTTY